MRSMPSTRSSRFWFPDQRLHRVGQFPVVAEPGETLAQLAREGVVDGVPLLARGAAEERLVDPVQAAELLERP